MRRDSQSKVCLAACFSVDFADYLALYSRAYGMPDLRAFQQANADDVDGVNWPVIRVRDKAVGLDTRLAGAAKVQ